MGVCVVGREGDKIGREGEGSLLRLKVQIIVCTYSLEEGRMEQSHDWRKVKVGRGKGRRILAVSA